MNLRFEKTLNETEGVVWGYSSEKISDLYVVKFCLQSCCGSTQIQTSDFQTYSELKEEAKGFGFELLNSNIDGYSETYGITHTFKKNNYFAEFTEAKYKNGKGSLYSILIFKAE